MHHLQHIILMILLLTVIPGLTAEPQPRQTQDIINKLFTILPAHWTGQAIETPVGPVNYNISFHPCDHSLVAGVAELGPSDHVWQFQRDGSGLRLTFLSTFAGNQQPVRLVSQETRQNTIHLHAPDLALLTLAITLQDATLEIRVFHHREPHVRILLTLTNQPGDSMPTIETAKKGCWSMPENH